MHPAAYDYVSTFRDEPHRMGLDIGGRDVNGHARDNFPGCRWTVLDKVAGPGVDLVVDATTWRPLVAAYDLVLCTEVLEHDWRWLGILYCAYAALTDGGRLILTCAGPGRPQHSGIDGGPKLHEGERYANIDPGELMIELRSLGLREITVRWVGDDLQCTALAEKEHARGTR